MCIEQLASQISGGLERAMQKSVSIVLLLLFFLTMAEASNGMTPPHYICKQQDQPANCLNNPAIHIEMYSTGDTCTYQLTFNFKCYAICDFCKRSLLQDSGKCDENEQIECEQIVDTFLKTFCESISLNISNLIHTGTPRPTSTPESESIVTTVVLGCLLGLCFVLILVVTGGWVYTIILCRPLKKLQKPQLKNSLKEQRIANDSTDSNDGMKKHVHNPLHAGSISVDVHDHPLPRAAPIRQDPTNIPPPHKVSFNQNDAILSVIGSGATAQASAAAVDDQKEKYLKNPIYEGSLEFQADRYFERENYDCSQDNNDDYMYDALEQGSSPERDAAISKRFSDSGSIIAARREEISSISDFPVVRYDAVSRPHYEEGEDYDVLDHEIHVGSTSNREAASGFDGCNEEKHLKNPIYEESPHSSRSDKITRARDIQAARFDRVSSTLQDDSQDYDVLEPEIDVLQCHVVAASTHVQPVRYEDKSHNKSASHIGGRKVAPVVAAKPRNPNLHTRL